MLNTWKSFGPSSGGSCNWAAWWMRSVNGAGSGAQAQLAGDTSTSGRNQTTFACTQDILVTIHTCWLGVAGAAEEGSAGGALAAAGWVTAVLQALSSAGRFGLSVKLMGSAGKQVRIMRVCFMCLALRGAGLCRRWHKGWPDTRHATEHVSSSHYTHRPQNITVLFDLPFSQAAQALFTDLATALAAADEAAGAGEGSTAAAEAAASGAGGLLAGGEFTSLAAAYGVKLK